MAPLLLVAAQPHPPPTAQPALTAATARSPPSPGLPPLRGRILPSQARCPVPAGRGSQVPPATAGAKAQATSPDHRLRNTVIRATTRGTTCASTWAPDRHVSMHFAAVTGQSALAARRDRSASAFLLLCCLAFPQPAHPIVPAVTRAVARNLRVGGPSSVFGCSIPRFCVGWEPGPAAIGAPTPSRATSSAVLRSCSACP